MSIPPLEYLGHIGSFLAHLERLSEFSTSLASERGKVVSQISGALLFDGLTGSLNDTNRHTNILPKNRCPFDKTLFFGPVSCFPLRVSMCNEHIEMPVTTDRKASIGVSGWSQKIPRTSAVAFRCDLISCKKYLLQRASYWRSPRSMGRLPSGRWKVSVF